MTASHSTRFICAAFARSGALRSSVRDIRAATVWSGFSWLSVMPDAVVAMDRDHEQHGAVRVDVIGAILGVVLDDEHRRIEPIPRA